MVHLQFTANISPQGNSPQGQSTAEAIHRMGNFYRFSGSELKSVGIFGKKSKMAKII
jgi:hypothetical protein